MVQYWSIYLSVSVSVFLCVRKFLPLVRGFSSPPVPLLYLPPLLSSSSRSTGSSGPCRHNVPRPLDRLPAPAPPGRRLHGGPPPPPDLPPGGGGPAVLVMSQPRPLVLRPELSRVQGHPYIKGDQARYDARRKFLGWCVKSAHCTGRRLCDKDPSPVFAVVSPVSPSLLLFSLGTILQILRILIFGC